jgi:formylglycine-generating enzyme
MKIQHRWFFLIALLMLLIFHETIHAAVIWCNPDNMGSQNGLSKAGGFKTLHAALATMSAGDKLIISKGDWRKSPEMFIDKSHRPPNGSPNNYSRVCAEEDWNVKLPYIHIESPEPKQYLEFMGIVFDNEFIGKGIGHICYEMNHTKFIRCGFLAHGASGNSHSCGLGSIDTKRLRNRYNLMEDCIAWGGGRYVFYSKNGSHNIFRRCVARHDFNDAPQMFNFRAYACSHTVYQNCISIDSDRVQHYVKPVHGESGGFWVGDQYGANGNAIHGCISIKDIQLPYYIGGNGEKDHSIIRDSVALDVTVPGAPTLSAFILKSGTSVTASNVLGMKASGKYQDGFYGKKAGKFTVTDSILRDVGDIGLWANRAANINHYNAGKCVSAVSGGKLARLKSMFSCWGTGSTDYDPLQNGLRYPVRIEPESLLSTAGKNGMRCGPEILKKIGVSGTLYGEPGWNEVTDKNLWPFPNEEKIKELMRKTVDGVSGIYGFCVDGQTLTNYIWAYLGNTAPPFNVSAIPGNGTVTLKWDTPAEIAINSIAGFKVYKFVGQTKTLAGGTVEGNMNCSKTISGLKNGNTYEFAVAAIDKIRGESGLSYKVRVTPGNPEKLSVGRSSPATMVQKERGTEKTKEMAGKTFSNKLGMEFVLIRPGTFAMGVFSNKPKAKGHQVTLTKAFYIQKTEVTQGQWRSIMGGNPSFFKECGDDCPVEQVSWNEVQQFIKRLNQREKTTKYRLPTEAEWEYACRAGTQTPFSFGECLTSQEANYNGQYPFLQCERGIYRKKPISAKGFQPNPWGLIGIHGNVWEWCHDWLGKYAADSVTDPTGPPSGEFRVIRGGGWNSYANACRSGNRSGIKPDGYYANLGFRLARQP